MCDDAWEGEMHDGQAASGEGWYDEKWNWHDASYVAHDTCVMSDAMRDEITRQIQLTMFSNATPSADPSAGVKPSAEASASVQQRLSALAGPHNQA